jgi:carbamoyl-phosphate synthase large subunit
VTAVLFTCAGQRVDIVTAFGRAGAETVAADLNPLAPALYAADRYFLAPRIDDAGYVPALAAAVAEHGVELIVPLTDLDMTILADHRTKLGALVLLPDAEVAERTNDKFVTHLFLEERRIGSPAAWLPDELPSDLPFPVLVKARRGFGSRNIFRAENREELDFFLARTPAQSFVQEVCTGVEFSMDVFCDLEGRCLNSIPRTMVESKAVNRSRG